MKLKGSLKIKLFKLIIDLKFFKILSLVLGCKEMIDLRLYFLEM